MKEVRLSLFSFAVILLFVTKVTATVVIPPDSIPATKLWKISQQQFQDKYGRDDTSRAIINYFFKKHNTGRKNILINTLISSTGFTLFAIITSRDAGGFGNIIVGSPFVLAGVIFLTFVFQNVINMFHFSRKRLYQTLQKYFAGQKIPRSLKKHIFSQRHMTLE